MDILQLTGIKCYGYIGHSVEEKILGQWFEVDLEMYIDLQNAGQSDNLKDTLDYREVINGVKSIISSNKFNLVERTATEILNMVLDFEKISGVKLSLHKLHPPIQDFTGKVTIKMEKFK